MVLPGHLAAGYLATTIILKTMKPELDPVSLNYLIVIGTFFGMIPDLDLLWLFYKNGEISMRDQKNDHRRYISHTPILWIVISGTLILLAPTLFVKYIGIVLFAGVLSHFIFDSIQGGVMWLWPFKRERYFFCRIYSGSEASGHGFIRYWLSFIKYYFTSFIPTFWTEIFLTILAILVLVKY